MNANVGERHSFTGTRDIAQLTASWTHSLPNGRTSFTLGGQLTQEWATQERPDFSTDPDLLLTRNDDLWHFGASLVWGFAHGWSLRPTIEYNWEDSNIDELAYSSTEYWLTVRKSF